MTTIKFSDFYPTIITKVIRGDLPPGLEYNINNYVENLACLTRLRCENPDDITLKKLRYECKRSWMHWLADTSIFNRVVVKALEILMFVRGLLDQRHIRVVNVEPAGFTVEKIGDLQLENINREIIARYPLLGRMYPVY